HAAQRDVRAALREVEAEDRIVALVELDVEDEEQMAGRELVRLRVARRPRRDDEAAAHRVALELLADPPHLVVEGGAPIRVAEANWEVAPEIAVRARHAPALVRPG